MLSVAPRQWGLSVVGLTLAALALTGCQRGDVLESPPRSVATEVLASERYGASVDAATRERQLARIAAVVRDLRRDTTEGWQARQDDTTGRANELSGGRFVAEGSPVAVARTFLDRYGEALGLTSASDQLAFPRSASYDDAGVADLRLAQRHRGIPVDGGSVLVPVTRRDSGAEISLVRGRVFDVAEVQTRPVVSSKAAAAVVTQATGAAPEDRPALVVYTGAAKPVLAWATTVTPPKDREPREATRVGVVDGHSAVFVDATNGSLLGTRPLSEAATLSPAASIELGKYDFELPPAGRPVKASGTLPDGRTVSVNAEQLPDGSVVLVDATGPGANRETKKGIVAVFDGRGLGASSNAVGPILRLPSTQVTDTDALMAAWSARQVMDYYYEELGRLSFDGRNSPLLATVHYTEGADCLDNAYFATAPGESRMMLGVPCPTESGEPSTRTFADLSVVGHELAHGVTHTNALEFGNTVQQGAIDEGTSDYFGIIIENRVTGRVGTTGQHFGCQGLSNDRFCKELTAGQHGLRDINSGASFDDLVFTLSDPFGLASELGDDGHLNSMVWTNALWKARSALADRDGGDDIRSERARAFDRAVHRATTTYLDPTSDLLQAAEAVQRAGGEVQGLDGRDRETIREQFVRNRICRGCNLPHQVARHVAASSKVKVRPQVTSRGVVFTQYEGRLLASTVVGTTGGGQLQALDRGDSLAMRTAASGDWAATNVVTFDQQGGERYRLDLRNVRTLRSETLSERVYPFVAPALDGKSVAWVELDERGEPTIVRVRPTTGGQSRGLEVDTPPAHVAVSGGRVAIYFADGQLAVWEVGSAAAKRLGRLGPAEVEGVLVPPGGIALDGDRLAVLADPLPKDPTVRGRLLVYDLAEGTVTRISEAASPFGVTGLVVWPEVIGLLPGRVVEVSASAFPDTELRAYSFRTNRFYRMVGQRGQQGFPAYDGRTLAWQDTLGGVDDIFATSVPPGL